MLHQFEHGGNIHAALRSDNSGAWLDFSANINPLGLSEKSLDAIHAALPDIIHYPDVSAAELKQELKRAYKLDEANIILGNGAVELLYILCNLKRPQRALLPAPAFNEYERAARAAGAAIDYLYLRPEDNFHFDIELLKHSYNGQQIFFWGNPNNPTGTLLTLEQLRELAEFTLANSCTFVIDQSFIDFRGDGDRYTAHELSSHYPNVLVLHSLTKFFAIPGLRLGFASAAKEIVRQMELLKDPWNVNSLAQAAGAAALRDVQYQQTSRRQLQQATQELYQALQAMPQLTVYEPTVNFVLVRLDVALTAAELCRQMRAEHILIRDCSNYPGLNEQYVRFAIKQPAENQQLLHALQKFLKDD